jgi:hypothetical protein
VTARKYYGKYKGTVVNNVDPLRLGRLQATVPDVAGFVPSTFAEPCFPMGGLQSGAFTLPAVGSGVWIEFEQGNPDHPIWSGCWFGSPAEVPAPALASPPGVATVVLQTVGQNTLMLSDLPPPAGGVLIKTLTGAAIAINDLGIVISNGKGASISMVGPTVAINGTALVVT